MWRHARSARGHRRARRAASRSGAAFARHRWARAADPRSKARCPPPTAPCSAGCRVAKAELRAHVEAMHRGRLRAGIEQMPKLRRAPFLQAAPAAGCRGKRPRQAGCAACSTPPPSSAAARRRRRHGSRRASARWSLGIEAQHLRGAMAQQPFDTRAPPRPDSTAATPGGASARAGLPVGGSPIAGSTRWLTRVTMRVDSACSSGAAAILAQSSSVASHDAEARDRRRQHVDASRARATR